MYLIGIRREDKNDFERRVALTPNHVGELQGEHNVQVVVQPSPRRVFSDEAYREVGATVAEGLQGPRVILGIKEVPPEVLLPCKTYVFFSHTIKGQPYNMPMLRRLMELGCTLIDYERITDDEGRRLIFFGRHAGLAGMIDTLWALGQRLEHEGLSTPLARLRQTYQYDGLSEAAEELRAVGQEIREQGLPPQLTPLVFGISGYGNVSGGAQEILDLLGVRSVEPGELHRLTPEHGPLVKAVFREEHLVEPAEGRPFHLQDYYDHPERYRSIFGAYLPRLHVLVNCIYWAPEYPRLVTLEQLRTLYAGEQPALRVIGDISCDVEGSVQATVRATEPDNPVFVYDVEGGRAVDGVVGRGPVVMAVDNLPAELPRDASQTFSEALLPFVPDLVAADYDAPWEAVDLPGPLRRATIVYRGQLTPDYAYLHEFLK